MSAHTFETLSTELTRALAEQAATPPRTIARCTLGRDKVMVLVEYPLDSASAEPTSKQTLDWLEQYLREQFDTAGLPDEAADLSEEIEEVPVQLYLKHMSEVRPFKMHSFTWKVADGFDDLFGESTTVLASPLADEPLVDSLETNLALSDSVERSGGLSGGLSDDPSKSPFWESAANDHSTDSAPINSVPVLEIPSSEAVSSDTHDFQAADSQVTSEQSTHEATVSIEDQLVESSLVSPESVVMLPEGEEERVLSELESDLSLDLETDVDALDTDLDSDLEDDFGFESAVGTGLGLTDGLGTSDDLDLGLEADAASSFMPEQAIASSEALDADLSLGIEPSGRVVPNDAAEFSLPGEAPTIESSEFELPTVDLPLVSTSSSENEISTDFFELQTDSSEVSISESVPSSETMDLFEVSPLDAFITEAPESEAPEPEAPIHSGTDTDTPVLETLELEDLEGSTSVVSELESADTALFDLETSELDPSESGTLELGTLELEEPETSELEAADAAPHELETVDTALFDLETSELEPLESDVSELSELEISKTSDTEPFELETPRLETPNLETPKLETSELESNVSKLSNSIDSEASSLNEVVELESRLPENTAVTDPLNAFLPDQEEQPPVEDSFLVSEATTIKDSDVVTDEPEVADDSGLIGDTSDDLVPENLGALSIEATDVNDVNNIDAVELENIAADVQDRDIQDPSLELGLDTGIGDVLAEDAPLFQAAESERAEFEFESAEFENSESERAEYKSTESESTESESTEFESTESESTEFESTDYAVSTDENSETALLDELDEEGFEQTAEQTSEQAFEQSIETIESDAEEDEDYDLYDYEISDGEDAQEDEEYIEDEDSAYYLEGVEGEEETFEDYEDVALVDDVEVQRQREQWKQQSKGNPFVIVGAFGFVLMCVLGYVFTRPCTVGSCDRIETAQEKGSEAISSLSAASTSKEVTESKKELKHAIQMLEPIPVWSSHYDDAQAMLPGYEQQLTALDLVTAAQAEAYSAAVQSQDPPHPASTWQEVADKWRESTSLLSKVPLDSPVRGLAERKLVEYRANLSTILVRIEAEAGAEVSLRQAQAAATRATEKMPQADSLESWEAILADWSTAVDNLKRIPKGSQAYGEAQGLLPEYEEKLLEARSRVEQEQSARRILRRAEAFSNEAKIAEKEEQWTASVENWSQAVFQLGEIPESSLAYSEAQSRLVTYTGALGVAENNMQVSLRFTPIEPSFYLICGASELQKCTYSVTAGKVRLELSEGYDAVINASITPPPQRTGLDSSAQLVSQSNQLLQQITLLSTQAQIPIELYDSQGEFLARYRPDLDGFVRQ